jgi:hypothetical protein
MKIDRTPAGWAERAFTRLAEAATARPRWGVAAALVLAAAALVLASARLQLKTSNLDLVDPDLPAVARFRELARNFGTPNMLIVVLEGPDPARLREAADLAAGAIRGAGGVRAVFARLPYEPLSLARLGVAPYFSSADGRMFFLFVQPADADSSAATLAPFVRGVRERIGAAGLPPGVRAGLTGLPQYALDDRDVIQRDTSRLSAVSFALVLALFAAGFGAFRRPLLAAATLAVTAALVLGIVTVAPGHLTLVSATFFSALFGLGIDYGIHVVDRFEERLGEGRERRDAVVGAVRELGPGLATGALTTAAAFFTMAFSGFRGFEELGLIGGTGILLALLMMTTLLPALLMLAGGGRRRERRLGERRLGKILVAAQRPALAALLAGAALAGLAAGPPPFDGDYLNLQPQDSEAARLEREMVRRSDFSPQFAAFLADSPARVNEIAARLSAEDTVDAVHSSADLALLDAAAVPIPAEREAFRAGFEGKDGRLAVYAYPKGNVWDPRFEARFLQRMRAIDPGVTGMPVLGRFMIDLSKRALRITAGLSALAVILLVALDLRSPSWCALALAPTAFAMSALMGAMRLLGLPFNPLNVMALPVILGAAVDSGVHVVHRYRQEDGDLGRTLAGTGRAVLLCALTTIAGFGSLAFTSHRGLASFALVLTLGVAFALVFSLLVLPSMLRLAAPR